MSNFKLKDRSPFGNFKLNQRLVASRNSFASVIYWHYQKQNFGVSSNVTSDSANGVFDGVAFNVDTGTIEEEIASVRISKSLSQSSATFELSLLPSVNWKEKISPGDWLAIYIFNTFQAKKEQRTKKNMLLLGNVDRVSRSIAKDTDNDKVLLRYVVSGRNFGKVFEDDDIWYDPFAADNPQLDRMLRTAGLPLDGSPDQLVKKGLNVFLGPGQNFGVGTTPPLQQWRIPKEIGRFLGSANATPAISADKPVFYDVLRQQVQGNLPGYKANQMITPDDNGSLWGYLKRSANEIVNELFVEEVKNDSLEAVPTLILRPKPISTPFLRDGSHFNNDPAIKSILSGASQTLQELSKSSYVEISPAEIRFENVGKDDHSRFNLFWLSTTLNNRDYMLSKAANLNLASQIANPTFQRQSLERYGLKKLSQSLEFAYVKAQDKDAPVIGANMNVSLFQSFMAQIYDFHFANHLYDSGTIECTGVPEAELGKALIIKALIPGDIDKIFYTEGYEHRWQFPNTWTTTFTVTHGQFKDDGSKNIFIDATAFKGKNIDDKGRKDNVIDTVYLAKTQTEKQ